MRIYVHSISFSDLDPEFGAGDASLQQQLDRYAERAILLAGPDDVVLLADTPDPDYIDWLRGLGFGIGTHFVPRAEGNTLIERVLEDSGLLAQLCSSTDNGTPPLVCPYFGGEREWALAHAIGGTLFAPNAELTHKLNSKIAIRAMLADLGLPLAEGTVTEASAVRDTVTRMLEHCDAILVRGEHSCGGSSVWTVREQSDLDALESRLATVPDTSSFIIEKLYDPDISPNIQFIIDEDGVSFFGASVQILGDGLAHQGNTWPVDEPVASDVQRVGHRICEHLATLGCLGLVGIDFIVLPDATILPVELNARVNASSFMFTVLDTLYDRQWQAMRFKLLHNVNWPIGSDFSALRQQLDGLLIDTPGKHGVFPYNTGCLPEGQCDLIIIANDWGGVVEIEQAVLERSQSGVTT